MAKKPASKKEKSTPAPKVVPVAKAPVTEVPNHGMKISMRKGMVRVHVDLHHISPKVINFKPTRTRFHLDTLRHSKKYLVDFEFPDNIQVDALAATANLEHGVLIAMLPIVDWGTKQTTEFAILHPDTQAGASQTSTLATTTTQSRKRKQKAAPAPAEPLKSVLKTSKKKQKHQSNTSAATAAGKRRRIVSESKSSISTTSLANVEAITTANTKKNKKKGKHFPAKDEAMAILNQVTSAVEAHSQRINSVSENRLQTVDTLVQMKKDRKARRRHMKKQLVEQLKQKDDAERLAQKKQKKKLASRTVRFAE
jgi:hypothetical protein